MRVGIVQYGLVGAVLGVVLGIGAFTFWYARGYAYLLDDPQACANCHVMQSQYASWHHSSHRAVATCNSCHMPHDLIGKVFTKLHNGFWHSYYFTRGNFPEPIRITPRSAAVVEANCRTCHTATTAAMDGAHAQRDQRACVTCHGSVGHPK